MYKSGPKFLQARNVSEIFKKYILFRRVQLVELLPASQSIVVGLILVQ